MRCMAHNMERRFDEKPERTFGDGLNGKKTPKRRLNGKKGEKKHKKSDSMCLKQKKTAHFIRPQFRKAEIMYRLILAVTDLPYRTYLPLGSYDM